MGAFPQGGLDQPECLLSQHGDQPVLSFCQPRISSMAKCVPASTATGESPEEWLRLERKATGHRCQGEDKDCDQDLCFHMISPSVPYTKETTMSCKKVPPSFREMPGMRKRQATFLP